MTGWAPDPYRTGPTDPHAGRPAPGGWYPPPGAYPGPASWEPAAWLPVGGLPGVGLGGTVVGYVLAALLLVTGFLLLVGAEAVSALSEGVDGVPRYHVAELVVAGIANWGAAGLLVAGGVLLTTHRARGRVVLLTGAGLVAVLAVYWVVRFPAAGIVGWAVAFVLLAATAAALVLPPAVGAWLAAPRPSGDWRPPPPGSGPAGAGPFGS